MQKYIVYPDGRKIKLSPVTEFEFLFMDPNWAGVEYDSFRTFLKANDYHIAEEFDLNNDGGVIEMYDGEARLMWNVYSNKWEVADGFPKDDGDSVHFGQGDGSLDIYYANQYVCEEKVGCGQSDIPLIEFKTRPLEFTPVLVGTVVGKLYVKDVLVAKLCDTLYGEMVFEAVGDEPCPLTAVSMNRMTGQLNMLFGEPIPPCDVKAIFSYEYNYDFSKHTQQVTIE